MYKFYGSAGGAWIAFAAVLVFGFVLSCGVVVSGYGSSAQDEDGLQSYSGLGVKDVVGPLMMEVLKLRSQLVRLDSTLERKEAHIRVIENELMELRDGRTHGNFPGNFPSPVRDGDVNREGSVAGDSEGSESLSLLLEAELESMAAKARQLERKVVMAKRKSEQDHLYAQALKRRAQVAEQNAADLQFEHQRRSQAY